jgi:hypothetical protein
MIPLENQIQLMDSQLSYQDEVYDEVLSENDNMIVGDHNGVLRMDVIFRRCFGCLLFFVE